MKFNPYTSGVPYCCDAAEQMQVADKQIDDLTDLVDELLDTLQEADGEIVRPMERKHNKYLLKYSPIYNEPHYSQQWPNIIPKENHFYGFETSPFWYPVIRSCLTDIENYVNIQYKDAEHKPQVLQVKEKFGELRIYMNFCDEKIDEWIRVAEEATSRICPECGLNLYYNEIGTCAFCKSRR